MERLTVLCFAGTYALALAGELARFAVRAPARWYATLALFALAWVVQTAYLLNLGLADGNLPVTTPFESLVVLSWIVAAVGLYLTVRSPRTAVGTFVLPIVVGLATLAGTSAPRQADWGSYGRGVTAFWGMVHGVFLLAGAVSTCVAFAAGLMYLVQSNRLKHKRPSRLGFNLPSLEQSERLNRGAITLAFPLLTFGLLIGVILGVGVGTNSGGAALRWTDPKVVSALLTWLVFAALLHARFRPAMRGRGVVVLTIIAFAFLAFTWVGVEALRLPTRHGSSPRHGGEVPAPAPAGRGL
jgi:ABC-type transport system involved in cytochrome c biogenesis permease subunit